MKCVCAVGELKRVLSLVRKIADGKVDRPEMGCVKLVAAGDGLTLTVANAIANLTCTVIAEVAVDGTALVPAGALARVIGRVGSDRVELVGGESTKEIVLAGCESGTTENDLVVISGEMWCVLRGMPIGGFPDISDVKGEEAVVSADALGAALRCAMPALCKDESRAVLTGACLAAGEGCTNVYGTDGRRLVKSVVQGMAVPGEKVIVPAGAVGVLVELLGGGGEWKVVGNEGRMKFSGKGTVLVTRLIAGGYPKAEDLVRSAPEANVTVGRKALMDAVDLAAVFQPKLKAPHVTLAFGKNTLTVKSEQADVGGVVDEIVCVYDGPEVSIKLNPVYVRDALGVMEGEMARIGFIGPAAPVKFCETDGCEWVVMPMRV